MQCFSDLAIYRTFHTWISFNALDLRKGISVGILVGFWTVTHVQ